MWNSIRNLYSGRCRAYGASQILFRDYPALTGWANFCRASGALVDRRAALPHELPIYRPLIKTQHLSSNSSKDGRTESHFFLKSKNSMRIADSMFRKMSIGLECSTAAFSDFLVDKTGPSSLSL
jgi:hypothetical protein